MYRNRVDAYRDRVGRCPKRVGNVTISACIVVESVGIFRTIVMASAFGLVYFLQSALIVNELGHVNRVIIY